MPVPPIEHHRADRTLTPEDPCTFTDNCTPDDFRAWANLAAQWIGAARVAARDAQEHAAVDRALQFWGQLVEAGEGCSALDCHHAVHELVELTQRARGYVEAWGGEGVDSPGAWELPWDLPDLFPDIPGVPGLDLEKAAPWLLLGLIVASLSGDRR